MDVDVLVDVDDDDLDGVAAVVLVVDGDLDDDLDGVGSRGTGREVDETCDASDISRFAKKLFQKK